MRHSFGPTLFVATCLMAACGSDSHQPPSSFDLQAANTMLVTNGELTSVTLDGTVAINGVATALTGTGTLTLAPGAMATFGGSAAVSQDERIAGNVTVAGQSTPYNSTVTSYYSTAAHDLLGRVTANEYDVAQSPIRFPTSVMFAANGSLGTLNRYTDSTQGVSLGTTQLGYSYLGGIDRPGLVAVEIIENTYDTQNMLVGTATSIYRVQGDNTMVFSERHAQSTSGTLRVTAP